MTCYIERMVSVPCTMTNISILKIRVLIFNKCLLNFNI